VVRIVNIEMGLELAKNVAKLSNHRTRVGCVITDAHGHVLSLGINQYKTHPRQYHYASLVGEHKKIYLHAEISGIIHAGSGARKIYVARLGKGGECRAATPCPICQLAIAEAGITQIFST